MRPFAIVRIVIFALLCVTVAATWGAPRSWTAIATIVNMRSSHVITRNASSTPPVRRTHPFVESKSSMLARGRRAGDLFRLLRSDRTDGLDDGSTLDNRRQFRGDAGLVVVFCVPIPRMLTGWRLNGGNVRQEQAENRSFTSEAHRFSSLRRYASICTSPTATMWSSMGVYQLSGKLLACSSVCVCFVRARVRCGLLKARDALKKKMSHFA